MNSPKNHERSASSRANAKLARGGRPLRQIDPTRLNELLAAGLSLRGIAREMHVGYGTLYRQVLKCRTSDPQLIQNPLAEAL